MLSVVLSVAITIFLRLSAIIIVSSTVNHTCGLHISAALDRLCLVALLYLAELGLRWFNAGLVGGLSLTGLILARILVCLTVVRVC